MPGNRKAGMKNIRKVFARKAAALVGCRGVHHGLEQPPQVGEREKIVPYMSVAGTAPGHQFPNEVPSRVNFIAPRGNATNTTSSAIKCIQMHNGAQTRTANRTSMKLIDNLHKHIATDTVGDVAVFSQNQTKIKRPSLMQRDTISMTNQLRKTVCLNQLGAKPYPSNCKSVQTTNSAEAQQIENLKRVHSGEMKSVPRQKLKLDASTCISDTINKISSMRSLRIPLQTTSSSLARQLQKSSLYPSGWSIGNPTKLEEQTSCTSLNQIPTLRRAGRYKSPASRPTNLNVETSLIRSRNGNIINTDDIICLLSGKEKKLIKAVQKKKVGAKVLKRDLPADAELDAKLERLIKLASSTKRKRLKKTARRYLNQIKRDRLKSDFSSQLKRSSSSSSIESFNVGGQDGCYCSEEDASDQSGDNNASDGKLSLNDYKSPTLYNQNHKVELECDKIVVCCCNTSSNKRRLRIECCNKSEENQVQNKTKGTKDQISKLRNTQTSRNSVKTRLHDKDAQNYKNETKALPSRRQSSEFTKEGSKMVDRSDQYSKRRPSVRSQEGYNDTDNRGNIQNKNRSKQNSLVISDRKQKVSVNDDYSDNDRYDNHTQNSVFNDSSEQPDVNEYCQPQCKYPSSWKMCCDPDMLTNSVCCPFRKCPTKEKYSKPKMSGTELMFDKSDLRMTNIERISLPPGINARGDTRKYSVSKNNDTYPNNRAYFDVESSRNSSKNTENRNERSSKGAATYEEYSRTSGYANDYCEECECKENLMRKSPNLNEHEINTKGFEDTRKIDRYHENNWRDQRSQQLCDSCCDLNACLCNCKCPVSDFNDTFNHQENGWDGPFSQQQQQNGCDEYCNCLYMDINGFKSTNTSSSNRNKNDSRMDRINNVCDLCCDCCEYCGCNTDFKDDDRKHNKGYKKSKDKETPQSRLRKNEEKRVDTSDKNNKPKPNRNKHIDNTPRIPRKTVPNKSNEKPKSKNLRKINEDSPSSTNRIPNEKPQRHIDRQNKKTTKTVERDIDENDTAKPYRNKRVENHPTIPRITVPNKTIEQPRITVPKKNIEQPRNYVPHRKKEEPRITAPNKYIEQPKRNNTRKMSEDPPRSTTRVPNKIPQRRSDIKNDVEVTQSNQRGYGEIPKIILIKPKGPAPKRPQKPVENTRSNKPFERQEVSENIKPRKELNKECCNTSNCVYKRSTSNYSLSGQTTDYKSSKGSFDSDKKLKGPAPKRLQKPVENTRINKPRKEQKKECCNTLNCAYKHSTSNYSLSGQTTDYKSSKGSFDSDKKLKSRNSDKSDSRARSPNDCDDSTCDRKKTGRTIRAKNLRGGGSNFNYEGTPRECNDVKVIYNSSSKFSKAEKSSNASSVNGEKRLPHNKVLPEYNISESGLFTSGLVEDEKDDGKSLNENNISICKCCDRIEHVDPKTSDNDIKSLSEISRCSMKNFPEKCCSKRNHGGYNDCPNLIDPDEVSKEKKSENKFYRLTRTFN